MTSSSQHRDAVELRARGRCEYCLMHQSLQGATFNLEHIVPISRGGATQLDNLCLACPSWNLHKADRVEAVDPNTGETISLFHPRQHQWEAHFEWDAYALVGKTPIARAMIEALQLNHIRRLQIREAEQRLGMFPPKTSESS